MKNIGSIISIYYALASDIASISSPDENGAVELSFNSGKSFSQFDFTTGTAGFNQDPQENDAGPFFSQSLSCKLPKTSAATQATLEAMRDQEFILAITDANKSTVIMGTLDSPARFSYKIIIPPSPSGYNGYDVSFRSNTKDPAPYLDESFVLS